MKKIILFTLLITSLYSDAKVYLGTSYGYLNESFSDDTVVTNSAQTAKIKVGYGIREAYAVEFSLEYAQKDSDIFSLNDGDRYGLNLELMKAFDWDIYVNPFFKVGFGAGYVDIESEDKDALNFSSFNVGLGFFIPINERLDFEVDYGYKYTSYEKLNATADNFNSHLNIGYLGLNVRF
ncbi:MAG: outer membrane beta-barrel protein [Campylobacterota bacterium]|nr:outer membrane beta-barrel protein [Campylobacterota bacterium]